MLQKLLVLLLVIGMGVLVGALVSGPETGSRTPAMSVEAALGAVFLAPAYAANYEDMPWRVMTDDYACGLVDEEMTVDNLRVLEQRGNPVGTAIEYVLNGSGDRLYLGFLRPVPNMHNITFTGKIGLRLKSGETIWANALLVPEDGVLMTRKRGETVYFDPNSNGLSASKNSYMMFVAFPDRTANGDKWKHRKVDELVVE